MEEVEIVIPPQDVTDALYEIEYFMVRIELKLKVELKKLKTPATITLYGDKKLVLFEITGPLAWFIEEIYRFTEEDFEPFQEYFEKHGLMEKNMNIKEAFERIEVGMMSLKKKINSEPDTLDGYVGFFKRAIKNLERDLRTLREEFEKLKESERKIRARIVVFDERGNPRYENIYE